MNSHAAELRLRVYTGKEHGLMIIGKPQALRSLGAKLAAAADSAAGGDWPQAITSEQVESPYAGIPEFNLSFHVEPSSGIPESLRFIRRAPSIQVVAPVLVLAVVGLVSVVRTLVAHAF